MLGGCCPGIRGCKARENFDVHYANDFNMKLLVAFCLLVVGVAGQKAFLTNGTYDGGMSSDPLGGYIAARLACNKEYPGSRVCLPRDLELLVQTDGLWIIQNHFADVRFVALDGEVNGDTGKPVDDCKAFTSNSGDDFGRCLRRVFGGPIIPSECRCDEKLSWMCCM
eukprot:TRINITY_DN83854_c0_g1_i1.p1 TRINITY_DN83854_c0_g1~~TRINITY_DN83854_c0_g1_i1.p1  ORF type:complete len:167 (-),score=17.38 TRINITY_DN83854_c0_g1_i1:66-566(-)